MMAGPQTSRPPHERLNWKLISFFLVLVFGTILIGANGHLVYVAQMSQPDCVAHNKVAGEGESFRAARSAC